jgi:hypothetical protein
VFSVLLSLLLLTSPVFSQDAACRESELDLYSVVGRTNTSLNSSLVLLNITTRLDVNNYTATLPSSYTFGYLWIQVIVPINATFSVTCNSITQSVGGSSTFTSVPGGTFVQVAPIYALGAYRYTNLIVIAITNTNSTGATCRYTDTFNIVNTPNVVAVSGDPMFAGLRGQSFQVHGIDGAVYNLISDTAHQVNSRFVFLNGPRLCPLLPSTNKKSSSCWSHPGSYLGELGVKTSADDRIFIQAGSAVDGFELITFNGQPVKVGSEVELGYLQTNLGSGSLIVNNTHELQITVGYFTIQVENIDGFLNLRSVKVDSDQWGRLSSHGLLGQTWQNKRYSGKVQEIEGEVDDYVITDDNIFGDNFVFNKFEL